ncbi:hypothetical protein CLF_104782 [Clonorchis sinensis]|uniref:Uncharacterized protein n=1 Tax=Clonorchis sinensis TaxID=79923 RepID=G7YCB9_CLOSI|nr:hypothetical protein CLF_104782 [Clonorchis sinensis]
MLRPRDSAYILQGRSMRVFFALIANEEPDLSGFRFLRDVPISRNSVPRGLIRTPADSSLFIQMNVSRKGQLPNLMSTVSTRNTLRYLEYRTTRNLVVNSTVMGSAVQPSSMRRWCSLVIANQMGILDDRIDEKVNLFYPKQDEKLDQITEVGALNLPENAVIYVKTLTRPSHPMHYLSANGTVVKSVTRDKVIAVESRWITHKRLLKVLNTCPAPNLVQMLLRQSFSCSTLSVPNCHATRRKHESWDTAKLPKPRHGKSRGTGRARTTDLPEQDSEHDVMWNIVEVVNRAVSNRSVHMTEACRCL